MPEPFKWAILGTGAVARKFVLDLRQLKGRAVAHVVASRNPANAQTFASTLGVPEAATDYAAAINSGVDAVYIATPPSLHEAHARLAIHAGKAVLIEKPIAQDAPAAQRIADLSRDAGVFCMEAMWTRFLPLLGSIQAEIEAGALGDLRGFEARFMASNTPDPQSSLFDPDRGGGAMTHRGIYPISLARFLLGPVTETQVMAHYGAHGVDEDSAMLLRHHSGAITSLRASLRATGHQGAALYGTRATLYLDGPIWRPTGARLVQSAVTGTGSGTPRRFEAFRESGPGLRLSGLLSRLRAQLGRGERRIASGFSGNGYHYEAEAVMQAVGANSLQEPRMPLTESIEILEIIDQIRQHSSTRKIS